jgi:hypothetical protein
MAITISGDSPNLTSANLATSTLTSPTLTSPTFSGTPTGVGVLTSGTAVTLTNQTVVDFSSIPSWVKRITIMLAGASTNGTSLVQAQLGDAGGIETTGYLSTAQNASSTANSTTGYLLTQTNPTAASLTGNMFLCKIDGNTWILNGDTAQQPTVSASVSSLGGSKTLSDTLTTVRITTVNGTDQFDAGSINILYE